MFHITAIQDFGNYKRGDHIKDEAEVARILDGEHHQHVVKVAADLKPVEVTEQSAAPVEEIKPNAPANVPQFSRVGQRDA